MTPQQFLIGYCIVEGDNPQELAMRVQAQCQQGFVPTGGVCVTGTVGVVGLGGIRFFQAMFVKEPVTDAVERARGGLVGIDGGKDDVPEA